MNTKHVILTQHYPSPCGDLILGSYEDRLCLCNWVIEKHQGRVDKRLWHKLLEIPYGQTLSYGEMAKRLDIPNAVRAVANANGANAISIFVPCHRVIGSDRSLTGYGGGLTAKKYLLELESIATVGIFASSL